MPMIEANAGAVVLAGLILFAAIRLIAMCPRLRDALLLGIVGAAALWHLYTL